MRGRVLALLVLLAAAAAGAVSARRVADQVAALEACRAAESGDWQEALARSEGRVDASETGLAAAECRCSALLATGAGDRCDALLERLLSDPQSGDWAPRPQLSAHLIQTWREDGRAQDAAGLARRAAGRHPGDPDLFFLELATRSALEDEAGVLAELRERVGGPHAARMRVSLANRFLLRGDPGEALSALGEAPAAGDPALSRWFELRGMAHASAGDLASLRASYAAWLGAGGHPAELAARYALTLSIAGLADSERSPVELLRGALSRADEIEDAELHESLWIRLILTLVNAGAEGEALEAFTHARQRFPLEGLSQAELTRAAAGRKLAEVPADRRRGTLHFEWREPPTGAALWVSPEPGAPPDADYERVPMAPSGSARVQREAGEAPQRWVAEDGAGRVLASGTVAPQPGGEVGVVVRPGAPGTSAQRALSRRPADGRARVLLLLLDCADWRIVQYLRARGELPTLDALIRHGFRAVLDSDPPLTAAALESLVWPGQRGDATLLGRVHQLGTELAGLAAVGDNPVGWLSWLLPERPDLFSILGAGRHTVANLLFSHGGIRAGRHGELTGPEGRRRRVPVATSARDLLAEERAAFPDLVGLAERDAVHLRTIAAELDAARQIAAAGEVDLLLLRVEPLDILTHAHFAAAVSDGQDDGRGLLFSVYRYIDARLADVHDALDADDVLIVLSDHGIRSAMEHSRDAFFAAAGGGVPRGRSAGRPSLRGVPRLLADLLRASVDWPDTGISWLLAEPRSRDDPPDA